MWCRRGTQANHSQGLLATPHLTGPQIAEGYRVSTRGVLGGGDVRGSKSPQARRILWPSHLATIRMTQETE